MNPSNAHRTPNPCYKKDMASGTQTWQNATFSSMFIGKWHSTKEKMCSEMCLAAHTLLRCSWEASTNVTFHRGVMSCVVFSFVALVCSRWNIWMCNCFTDLCVHVCVCVCCHDAHDYVQHLKLTSNTWSHTKISNIN